MKIVLSLATAALLAVSAQTAPCEIDSALSSNKVLALDSFFNKRDPTAVDQLAVAGYKQHDPTVLNGPEGFIGTLPPSLRVEFGAQTADDQFVWTHSRYSGIPGSEVPASQTASGNPMLPITL
ncbi:hypothetical protein Gpo141_00006285 [Globisporangium polare]